MKPWNCQGKFCRTIHMRIRQPLIPTKAAPQMHIEIPSQDAGCIGFRCFGSSLHSSLVRRA